MICGGSPYLQPHKPHNTSASWTELLPRLSLDSLSPKQCVIIPKVICGNIILAIGLDFRIQLLTFSIVKQPSRLGTTPINTARGRLVARQMLCLPTNLLGTWFRFRSGASSKNVNCIRYLALWRRQPFKRLLFWDGTRNLLKSNVLELFGIVLLK